MRRKGMFWMVPFGIALVAGLVLADDESDRTTVTAGEPDCISGSRCIIYEFKPDSPTGEAAYKEQESRYLRGVTDFLVKHLSNGTVPSIRGGQQLIDNLKKNSCWDATTKRLNLRIEMARYRVCEKRYECVTP